MVSEFRVELQVRDPQNVAGKASLGLDSLGDLEVMDLVDLEDSADSEDESQAPAYE